MFILRAYIKHIESYRSTSASNILSILIAFYVNFFPAYAEKREEENLCSSNFFCATTTLYVFRYQYLHAE